MVQKFYKFENLIIALLGTIIILSDTNKTHLVWYLICIILPDISLLGYFINKKIGSVFYNIIHNYALGIILIVLGTIFPKHGEYLSYVSIGLIVHVGIDRFFGFGLKYADSFKHTHIQKL